MISQILMQCCYIKIFILIFQSIYKKLYYNLLLAFGSPVNKNTKLNYFFCHIVVAVDKMEAVKSFKLF